MPEQRGHGEPVGERTHHARLGSRFDVTDPGRGTMRLRISADEKQHRRADQEARRDQLHPAQCLKALGVTAAVHREHVA